MAWHLKVTSKLGHYLHLRSIVTGILPKPFRLAMIAHHGRCRRDIGAYSATCEEID
jgi:hypothetical protein